MDILTYINRMNQIYGNDTQVASITDAPFMAPELQEDISPMPNIPDLLREEGIKVGEQVKAPTRYNTMQYLQGGRVGYKPGGIVEPGVMYYGKDTFGAGTKVKAIDSPKVIEAAEKILTDLVEKKHGHKVLDWSEKSTHPLLKKSKDIPVKNHAYLNELIIKIADKKGWLKGTEYKNIMVVETFMDEYARNGYFTGEEKTSDLLKEFQSKKPGKKFQEINKAFRQWKNGEIIVEGYDINNLEKETLEALDNWSSTMTSERSINKTNQLKYLDGLNNKNLKLDQVKARFYKKFPNALPKAFQHRIDQLYQLKVEGKIPSGRKTFKTHDVVKGERSDWLKLGKKNNRAGNYNKLLIAADELDVLGKTKQATRLRNASIKYFSPNKGILAKVPGEAEHPWFRSYGGASGQLKIDSLVRGDLNTFKNLNFEAPIEKLRKQYVNASPDRKKEIQKLIKNRQLFMDELTGGMTKNVKFSFTPNEVKVINLTKPIDTLKMRELGLLKEKGVAFEKSILSKGQDLGLVTKEGQLIKKQVSDKVIKTYIEELGCGKATGGRVGFAEGSRCFKKGQKKMEELLIKGTGTQTQKGLIAKIMQGAGTLLSPKELIRPVNLFGPAALAIFSGIEAGIISNDVINKGTPIKEALGDNWMTSWAMPKTLMEYQIEDLEKTGKLDSPVLKNFAQTTKQMAELDRLYNTLEINKAGGISTADTEKQIKKLQDEITSTMKKNKMTLASFEPGSAAMLEFQNKLTEKEAKQLASTKESNVSDLMRTGTLDMGNLKEPYKPMFGFDELKPKENIFRVDPKKGRMSKTRTVKDYTLPTYKTMTEEPVTEEERVYQQKRYGLKPEQRIEDYTDAETGVNLAKALELKKKWTQALYQPGMMGTQNKFKLGGRVSFSGGSMGRRSFLKLLAALGIGTAGAKSGISLFGKAVGKKAVSTAGVDIVSSTSGMPSWFPALVNKIVKEGDDVTAKLATQERQVVHTKKLPDGEEATVYRDLDTGDIRVEYNSVDNMGEGAVGPVQMEYKAGQVIDEGKNAGKKTDPEFSAVEPEPRYERISPDDAEVNWEGGNDVGNVDDLMSDTSRIKNYAEGKKPTIKEIVTRKRKTDKVKKLNEDTSAQVDYSVNKYGEGLDEAYDDYLPDIDDID